MTQEDDHICIFQLDEELTLHNNRVMNENMKWIDEKKPIKKLEKLVNPNAKLIKTQPRKIVVGFYVSFESER